MNQTAALSPTRPSFGAVGSIIIADATIARNYATSDGAGIYNAGFWPDHPRTRHPG
ncbi:hypothetical protein HC776_01720 [bacterium]|nr:hypothetical protein [bacterium]